MTKTMNLSHRLLYFTGIGSIASLVNLLIVYFLVQTLHYNPLAANVIAYLLSFNISYVGHKYITFAHLQGHKQLRFPQFFLVTITGGILNEFLYFLFLRYTNLQYLVALVIVLGLVAIYSFILSRYWACR